MSSIGDVGDELWRAHEQVEEAAASVRRAENIVGEAEASLGDALEGSSSAEAGEGLSLLRQAREVIEQALTLFRGGQDTMAEYIALITVRGPGGSRRHPDGAYRASDGKYAGRFGTSRSGAEAERQAHERLRALRFDVDERQQYTKTSVPITGTISSGPRRGPLVVPPGTIRKYDGAVKMGGQWLGVETKGGSASKTPEQRAIDNWLKKKGNTLTTADGKILTGVYDMRIDY
jgi:hypothetical protein